MRQPSDTAALDADRLDEVRRIFQPYAPYELTDGDAAEIDHNIRGFYATLVKWKRWALLKEAGGGVVPSPGVASERPDAPR